MNTKMPQLSNQIYRGKNMVTSRNECSKSKKKEKENFNRISLILSVVNIDK